MNIVQKAKRVVDSCKTNAQRQNAAHWLKLARRRHELDAQERKAISALFNHLTDSAVFEAIRLSGRLVRGAYL